VSEQQFQKLKQEQDELRKRLKYGTPHWALRHLLNGDPRLFRMAIEAKERNAHEAAPCRGVFLIAESRRHLRARHRFALPHVRRSGARPRGAGRPRGRSAARASSGDDGSDDPESDPARVATIVVARRAGA
jgi:hypothetical protein